MNRKPPVSYNTKDTIAVISVQPEIEENDNRNGSNFGQELSDPESDWPWLLTITEWVFRERI
ncbi:MAG: hypothetical protein P9L92_16240 [Candidatus Electryonea clarkiae]|nr:hypothetical protein [Candidatus Electryonea clarkiae]MDP8288582.1 hypothetical protein [Candidatus Electryonea clarkiae]